MLKSLIETVEARIALLASANLSLAGVSGFLSGLETYLNLAIKLGQLAVAIATVVYIVNKTLAVRNAKKDDE